MSPDTANLYALATTCLAGAEPAPARAAPRLISIWEITSWILPMAPEHLRRVLAAEPGLPQGRSEAGHEGSTRWFSAAEVATLRAHFARTSRGKRYLPARPPHTRAPLIALASPIAHMGCSTALLHLATAAALAGYRVLVIDADPGGRLASALGVPAQAPDIPAGVLALIARNAAQHLRRVNQNRLDRGEPPLAMDDTLARALTSQTADLIHPSAWPGLEVLPAAAGLLQADLHISRWRSTLPGWQPWGVLAAALEEEDMRSRYDLILADTGRGLGPLVLAVLASADVLLTPLPLKLGGIERLGAGLQSLAIAIAALEDEAQIAARALGQAPLVLPWRRLVVLPTQGRADAGVRLAGFAAKLGAAKLGPEKLGAILFSSPLPEIPQIAAGRVAQFYDMDYRGIGKLIYAPQRDACEAAWREMAALITGLWSEDGSQQSLPLPR